MLAVLTELVRKHHGRPVWAHEVGTALFRQLGRGGFDGRWVGPALMRLAAQGRAVRVRRWRTDLSRWTLPETALADRGRARSAAEDSPV